MSARFGPSRTRHVECSSWYRSRASSGMGNGRGASAATDTRRWPEGRRRMRTSALSKSFSTPSGRSMRAPRKSSKPTV
eukprot:10739153-Alexandrium_andersonii.AAC.1